MLNSKRKKLVSVVGAVALVMACSLSVFAATSNIHKNYTVTLTDTGEGEDVYLSNVGKEYTSVTVQCSTPGSSCTVALWKDGWPSDEWFGKDQELSVGKGRRAWWYGGDSGNYHLYEEGVINNGATLTTVGTFENFT